MADDWKDGMQAAFRAALDGFRPGAPVGVLCHNDADGLTAGAILARALARRDLSVETRVLGRGEGAWTDETLAELSGRNLGGLVVTDLGTRPDAVIGGVPTIVVDHHQPTSSGPAAGEVTVLSGLGTDPVPCSSLMAYWCAEAIGPADDLLWLAAMGAIGDLGDKAPFEEIAAAKPLYGATALREATSLVNAPRRTGEGDAAPAMRLLMASDSPKALLAPSPDRERLDAAREEVKLALEAGRRVAPRVVGEVALIRLDSPCQIHPLVAQSWIGRIRDKVIMAANTGFRPGWIHFAVRSGAKRDLIAFLREHRPEGADEGYGNGHEQATGGALRPEAWNRFVAGLGFGPEMQIVA